MVENPSVSLQEPQAGVRARLRRAWVRLRAWIAALWPGRRAWIGAGIAALAVGVLVAGAALGDVLSLSPWAGGFLLGAAYALAVGLLCGVALLGALWLLRRVPPTALALLFAALLTIAIPLTWLGSKAGLGLTAYLFAAATLFGAGVAAARHWGALTRLHRVLAGAGLALGGAALIFAWGWVLWSGPGQPAAAAAGESARQAAPAASVADPLAQAVAALPDPSTRGPYAVRTLTYGSGLDRRPEFGAEADLTTTPVDGSPFIDGWEGMDKRFRTGYFGFDVTGLPLNGTVWMPEGDGPFPLLLMVHGNHQMKDASDPGYAYLGELLASRGIIAVSVDQNFLNLNWPSFIGRQLRTENDARGWLLLEHLRQWRTWSEQPNGPFAGVVDWENVGLLGHSRGGEAVIVAAAFNRLPYYPDNAAVEFDYNFNLRGVVAVAPIDGQYFPARRSTPVEDVSYLVLHGSNDMDVTWFSGLRAYNRAAFPGGEGFKAALYIVGAIHGQFNTTWGLYDSGEPLNRAYNVAAVMPAEEQQRLAQAAVSAFLAATLQGADEYRAFFARPQAAPWLPDAPLYSAYAAAGDRTIASYEEDIDVTTATLPGATIKAQGLSGWSETVVRLKEADTQSSAAVLYWPETSAATPSYAIALPAELESVAGDALLFSLAAAESGDKAGGLIDLTVELADRSGLRARLPLSWAAPLAPQVQSRLFKADWLRRQSASEPAPQSYVFPLAAFAAAEPGFNPAALAEIRFVFNRSESGGVILDDVGLRGGAY